MAKRCGGLPLAIVTTAGSMKGKNDVCEWRNASVELNELIMSENVDEEKVFEIIKYSFDQLDRGEEKYKGYTKLQHCFLYCCLYPEDQEIKRTELIELFMSENLLDRKRSRRKRVDQGHVMLNKLVKACLLESDERWQWVKMHDVIRAMALKITEGIYMRIDRAIYDSKKCLNEEYWTEQLEKLSLMWNRSIKRSNSAIQIQYIRRNRSWKWSNSSMLHIPVEWTPNCPKLSTLLISNNDMFGVIPAASFSWMHNLHVLNISCCTRLEMLPDSLSNLKSLRSLLLSGCRDLKYVPYLGNLKELRELDISGTSIREVPQGMEELANLESLKIDVLKSIPSNLLLNFRKLQCLHLSFQIEAPVIEIVRLKQLEEFRGRVKDATDLISLMESLPHSKEFDRSYYVEVGAHLSVNLENRLYRAVKMHGIRLTQEGWTNATLVAADDIEELALRACAGLSSCFLDDLQRLNVNLKPLGYLNIVSCRGIKCVLRHEQLPIEGDLKLPFCNLRVMELTKLHDFEGVMISQRAVAASHAPMFSSLKKLTISNCQNMKTMGLPVWELQNLEELEVRECSQIEEIIQVADEYEYGVGNLPKLKRLKLLFLLGLKSISRARVVCPSIEHFEIRACVGVKKLPIVFGHPNSDSPPSALGMISISRSELVWWESLELEHPSLHHLLKPFLSTV